MKKIAEKKVLDNFNKSYLSQNKKIEEILIHGVYFYNLAAESQKRFKERMNTIITPLWRALETLEELSKDARYESIQHIEDAIRALGVVAHDMEQVREREEGRDYHPVVNENLMIMKTVTDMPVDYTKNYKEIIDKNDNMFTQKDVLKLVAAKIISLLNKNIQGDKKDNIIPLIQDFFNDDQKIGLTSFSVIYLHDEATGNILCHPKALSENRPKNIKDGKCFLFHNGVIAH